MFCWWTNIDICYHLKHLWNQHPSFILQVVTLHQYHKSDFKNCQRNWPATNLACPKIHHIHTCTHIPIYIYIYIYTHTHIYIYIHIHIYTCNLINPPLHSPVATDRSWQAPCAWTAAPSPRTSSCWRGRWSASRFSSEMPWMVKLIMDVIHWMVHRWFMMIGWWLIGLMVHRWWLIGC